MGWLYAQEIRHPKASLYCTSKRTRFNGQRLELSRGLFNQILVAATWGLKCQPAFPVLLLITASGRVALKLLFKLRAPSPHWPGAVNRDQWELQSAKPADAAESLCTGVVQALWKERNGILPPVAELFSDYTCSFWTCTQKRL
ncbi:hypothetical protein UY3_13033 [Chelonia mydas]|uniref:Uncharacterized protein n=1 Tax=Chelonia mydas TaxID=8469 RepID=M7AYP9_CHEMY|nr:hypothetical protein UY3_13033 [Chelonia mydas]